MADDLELIERLHALRAKGLLTEQEFASEKARVLSRRIPVGAPAVEHSAAAQTPVQGGYGVRYKASNATRLAAVALLVGLAGGTYWLVAADLFATSGRSGEEVMAAAPQAADSPSRPASPGEGNEPAAQGELLAALEPMAIPEDEQAYAAAPPVRMPPPAEQEERQAFAAPSPPPQTRSAYGYRASYSDQQRDALPPARSAMTQRAAAQIGPAPRPIVKVDAAPPPDPYAAADCAKLTARLRDGEGKLKNLGFDAQVRKINGLGYEQSGPIIAKALVLTQRYNAALMDLPPEQCVKVAQQGLGQINALLSPLAAQR